MTLLKRSLPTIKKRFWAKVNKHPGHFYKGTECWEWTGSLDRHGYGQFHLNGKHRIASRVVWLLVYDYLPVKACILHECDNPKCVRPTHLFPGSRKDNSIDMVAKGRYKVPGFCGSRHPRSKLNERKVLEIRRLYSTGTVTQRVLAADYGVTQHLINMIVLNRLWTHI